MSYLKFEKSELVNLEYALSRELIRSNRAGSYASTTIIGCNTRKYHGLLVCPLDELDGQHHVLLSTLDATVVQHDQAFNLGIHKYEGDNYVPKGHKYVRDYDPTLASYMVYRVGGVVLSREILLGSRAEQVLVRYTLLEAHSETLLRLQPFLAFRNFHTLSKSNLYANTRYRKVPNGIASCLYEGYPELFMQVSGEAEFVSVPDWYFNVEYLEEQGRGYEYKEDLYVPGYFEMPIRKGESIVFSASTSQVAPAGLKRRFGAELGIRTPKDSMQNCLRNAAQQFIVRRRKSTEIIAGFPWLGTWSRDSFMALPGLCLSTGDIDTARQVFDSMLKRVKDGMFPQTLFPGASYREAVDAPLWFIWALQQYSHYVPDADIWKKYGKTVKAILENYRQGTTGVVRMLENGLVYAARQGRPLTWMDSVVDGSAVTLREGSPVEINALWYNAIVQALGWADGKDEAFVNTWAPIPGLCGQSMLELYWDEQCRCLADCVQGDRRDMTVRPNQIVAVAMEHSPFSPEIKKAVLDVVEKELLTPRGLRTLSPNHPEYKGVYEGNPDERATAYHLGTVWPWLLEHYVTALLEVHRKSAHHLVRRLYEGFEDVLGKRGIGSVSEVYDGNPPHHARGAISQATAVAALLRIGEMIEGFE